MAEHAAVNRRVVGSSPSIPVRREVAEIEQIISTRHCESVRAWQLPVDKTNPKDKLYVRCYVKNIKRRAAFVCEVVMKQAASIWVSEHIPFLVGVGQAYGRYGGKCDPSLLETRGQIKDYIVLSKRK